jgi:hypothetical protein
MEKFMMQTDCNSVLSVLWNVNLKSSRILEDNVKKYLRERGYEDGR